MKTAKTAAAAFALALAAAPFAASAQTPPIAITDCSVLQYQPNMARPFWYPWPARQFEGARQFGGIYTDGLDITYVNKTHKPASRVAFVVDYRGDVEHVVDTGTFSPGVSINHSFGQFTGLAFLGTHPNGCRVAAVRFADGTVWRAHPMPGS
jgi:hypothetical protein